jgi:hypothetical protein
VTIDESTKPGRQK